MRATVKKVFVDKDGIQHEINEKIDFDEKRIASLANRGIVVADVAIKTKRNATKKGEVKDARES